MDNLEKKKRDANFINTNQDWEIGYWTTTLNCSEELLSAIVEAVGNDADVVKAFLDKLRACCSSASDAELAHAVKKCGADIPCIERVLNPVSNLNPPSFGGLGM